MLARDLEVSTGDWGGGAAALCSRFQVSTSLPCVCERERERVAFIGGAKLHRIGLYTAVRVLLEHISDNVSKHCWHSH